MLIDEKTRLLLTRKLNFTDQHLEKLEHNAGQAARIMNLLRMLKRSPNQKAVRHFVQVQLRKIRQSLDAVPYQRNELLVQARAEYYTFQRSFR